MASNAITAADNATSTTAVKAALFILIANTFNNKATAAKTIAFVPILIHAPPTCPWPSPCHNLRSTERQPEPRSLAALDMPTARRTLAHRGGVTCLGPAAPRDTQPPGAGAA